MTRKIPSDNTATFFVCAVQNEDSFWENCSKFACSSWDFCSAAHWLQFVLFVNVLVHIAVQQHERSGEENQRKKKCCGVEIEWKVCRFMWIVIAQRVGNKQKYVKMYSLMLRKMLKMNNSAKNIYKNCILNDIVPQVKRNKRIQLACFN